MRNVFIAAAIVAGAMASPQFASAEFVNPFDYPQPKEGTDLAG